MSPSLGKFLEAVESATGHRCETSGDGFKLWCPAHDGHSPALSVGQGRNGKPLIHCHAGCEPEAVLSAVGWTWGDLHDGSGLHAPATRPRAPGPAKAAPPVSSCPPTLAAFCEARHLDPEALLSRWKVEETAHAGRPALLYPTHVGVSRVKFLDGAKPKYTWAAKGGRAHWYGLPEAKRGGGPVLCLVNGEPSVWACAQEGVPAAALCGEGKKLGPDLLADLKASGFSRFAVVYDLDAAGRAGARATAEALRDAGLDALALALPQDLGPGGDVDDLHRRVGANLGVALATLPPVPEPQPSGPIVTPFTEIQAEEVSWLWEPYIPKGKLVLFQGDPSAGKTWAALALCARLISAGHKALYGTLEDGWADTLKPRADKLGIDPSRLLALVGRREEDGSERPLTLSDAGTIEQAVVEWKPALLVLDPISAWLQGADMNKANEVRGKLTPIVKMAERNGVTVLVLQHLTKAKTDRAIYRGQGSIDFMAAARSALMFGEARGGQRAMVQVKNSLGPLGKALGYTLSEEGFAWTGEVDLTAADLLEPEAGPEEKGEREDAAEWLKEALAGGPQEAGALQGRFEKETGHNRRTLRRALERMGGRSLKDAFSGAWKWAPPEGDKPPHEEDRDTPRVPFGETTTPKGLRGLASPQGDTQSTPVPLGPGVVPFDGGDFVEV